MRGAAEKGFRSGFEDLYLVFGEPEKNCEKQLVENGTEPWPKR